MNLRYLYISLVLLIAFSPLGNTAHAAWDLEFLWTSGDISTRANAPAAVYDRDQTGSSIHFLSTVVHGVRSFDTDGNTEWTYTGLPNSHDIRHIVVGDLQGTGYRDTIVACGGFASTAGSYHIAIIDKDGNELQEIRLTNGSQVAHCALDGTDLYAATTYGITKYIKSGATWAEDWSVALTNGGRHVAVDDMGNGKRIYIARNNGSALSLYPADGSQEWSATTGNYTSQFRIGKLSTAHTGEQMIVPYQNGARILDKDGTLLATLATGTNVRTGVTLYDSDGNGEDEIYLSDMGDDIYSWERTGASTWGVKYSTLNVISQPGVINFDINGDGADEIIAGSDDGTFAVFTADLSTMLFSTTSSPTRGNMGGQVNELGNKMNGTLFADITGDGHEDLIIAGASGYLDAWKSIGFVPVVESSARKIRLSGGLKMRLIDTRFIIHRE